jgi:hypothetical protein
MSPAVAAILEGMPGPRDLHLHSHGGRCVIMAGSRMLFEYASGDVVSRNLALSVLRQLGFRGRAVAELLGLTENYVATLHNAALRDGPAALIKQDRRGAPGKVTGQQREEARELRAGGCQRCGDRAAAGRRAHHRQPRPRLARAGRRISPSGLGAGRAPVHRPAGRAGDRSRT